MEVEAGRETTIAPTIANGDGATFEWMLDGEKAGTDATYTFKQSDLRDYQLTLRAENEDGEDEASVTVRVVERFTVTAVSGAFPPVRQGRYPERIAGPHALPASRPRTFPQSDIRMDGERKTGRPEGDKEPFTASNRLRKG